MSDPYLTVLTTRELSNIFKLSPSTIRRLRAEGVLRGYRIRRQMRFVFGEVLEDLAKAESELPIRRIEGTLIKSGGPRRKGTDSVKGAGTNNVEVIDDEEGRKKGYDESDIDY